MLVIQLIPKMLSGVEVIFSLFSELELEFFHFDLGKSCLSGPRFVHSGVAMLGHVWAA